MLEALCLASYVAQAGGAFTNRTTGTARPDIIQIFGGHSEVSFQGWRQGWFTHQPYDVDYGTDLQQPTERKLLLEKLEDNIRESWLARNVRNVTKDPEHAVCPRLRTSPWTIAATASL